MIPPIQSWDPAGVGTRQGHPGSSAHRGITPGRFLIMCVDRTLRIGSRHGNRSEDLHPRHHKTEARQDYGVTTLP